ncbi:unnamed protein product [Thlaspi arvense]|uniref:Neprosin PEP catalytic domain-containing protein n=1 Tax=Thlaspi arvense TaxID=13288 RepID=A0AAU9RFA8_THLAR|nr:unnamed protein product [Thlaspi arvense]
METKGSGKFPDEGFGKSAYFCNIQIVQENRTFLPLQDFNFTMGDTLRDSYTIKKAHNQASAGGSGSGSGKAVVTAAVTLLQLDVRLADAAADATNLFLFVWKSQPQLQPQDT